MYIFIHIEDLSFLSRGGRTLNLIRENDMESVRQISPHVVILMVGGNDLSDPAMSPLKVASDINDLAVFISAMESCYTVLVRGILPQLSYPGMDPVYQERVHHCNFILRNLLEVEEPISYFKLRGLSNLDYNVHIADGVCVGVLQDVSGGQGCGLLRPQHQVRPLSLTSHNLVGSST